MKTIRMIRNKKRKATAIFLIFVLGFSYIFAFNSIAVNASPDEIMLSWTQDPITTQTICWRDINTVSEGKVQYMPQSSYSGNFDNALEVSAQVTTSYVSGYNHFEATITNLTAGTQYVYRVGSPNGWSDERTFTTSSNTNNFYFAYMGDVQSGFDTWGTMINSMYQSNPSLRFSLMGGDLINTYEDTSEWQQFLDNATGVFSQIPMMSTRGNHDDSSFYLTTMAFPTNGPRDLSERCYSFDYGNAHFVVIDSNVFDNDIQRTEQNEWIKKDLASTDKLWKFVVFHIPIYGTFTNNGTSTYEESLVSIFENGGVDAVFTGHQHEYMRSYPLKSNQVVQDGNGIVYFMGSSGSMFKAPGGGFYYIAKEIAYVSNYQIINISNDTFSLVSKNSSGDTIDQYTFQKRTQYSVSVDALTGGTIVPSRKSSPSGDTVALTITPNTGKQLVAGSLKVNGTAITDTSFTMPSGNATITAQFETIPSQYSGAYEITPVSDNDIYQTASTNTAATMIVNNGVSGMKYFSVNVSAVDSHIGNEAVIFTQIRNGVQIGLNVSIADFDTVSTVQAGFWVQSGDVIKAYIVDNLDNNTSLNPVCLINAT